jgi:hypothetical protein
MLGSGIGAGIASHWVFLFFFIFYLSRVLFVGVVCGVLALAQVSASYWFIFPIVFYLYLFVLGAGFWLWRR